MIGPQPSVGSNRSGVRLLQKSKVVMERCGWFFAEPTCPRASNLTFGWWRELPWGLIAGINRQQRERRGSEEWQETKPRAHASIQPLPQGGQLMRMAMFPEAGLLCDSQDVGCNSSICPNTTDLFYAERSFDGEPDVAQMLGGGGCRSGTHPCST